MAMRKQQEEVFPNAAGIDVGGSSHWVSVPRHSCEESVREFGAMTDDLNALRRRWLGRSAPSVEWLDELRTQLLPAA